MEERGEEQERRREAGDLADDGEPAERLHRLVVREEERAVADRRRVAAERDRAEMELHGSGDVASEEA